MKALYKCSQCNSEFWYTSTTKLPFCGVDCKECGAKQSSKRTFKGIGYDREPETVSNAMQTMMWGGMPSGKDKALV